MTAAPPPVPFQDEVIRSKYEGPYVNLSADYTKATVKAVEFDGHNSRAERVSGESGWRVNTSPRGFGETATVGYMKKFNDVLVGVEAGLNFFNNVTDKKNGMYTDGAYVGEYPMRSEFLSGETINGRLGYEFGNNLVFLTAGVQGLKIKSGLTYAQPPGSSNILVDSQKDRIYGPAVGVGFEHAWDNFRIRSAYRYTAYKTFNLDGTLYTRRGAFEKTKVQEQTISTGLSYKF